jgi:hypothetical protein
MIIELLIPLPQHPAGTIFYRNESGWRSNGMAVWPWLSQLLDSTLQMRKWDPSAALVLSVLDTEEVGAG